LFTEADQRPDARWVLRVDRKFAERYFPGEDPVGQLFDFRPGNVKPDTPYPMIIGVVEVARVSGLETDGQPYVYRAQSVSRGGLSMELRTKRSFAEIMPQ